MRIYHRYLGFFLAGIMAVYAISGIILIFRDTDFLKVDKQTTRKVDPALEGEAIGKALRIKEFKIDKTVGNIIHFKQGTYDNSSGEAVYTTRQLPYVLDRMTKLHKANTDSPLFYLNIFFGLSLLFFVLSAFWMFLPNTDVFRKGLYFSLIGLVLTLLMLFI